MKGKIEREKIIHDNTHRSNEDKSVIQIIQGKGKEEERMEGRKEGNVNKDNMKKV